MEVPNIPLGNRLDAATANRKAEHVSIHDMNVSTKYSPQGSWTPCRETPFCFINTAIKKLFHLERLSSLLGFVNFSPIDLPPSLSLTETLVQLSGTQGLRGNGCCEKRWLTGYYGSPAPKMELVPRHTEKSSKDLTLWAHIEILCFEVLAL